MGRRHGGNGAGLHAAQRADELMGGRVKGCRCVGEGKTDDRPVKGFPVRVVS